MPFYLEIHHKLYTSASVYRASLALHEKTDSKEHCNIVTEVRYY